MSIFQLIHDLVKDEGFSPPVPHSCQYQVADRILAVVLDWKRLREMERQANIEEAMAKMGLPEATEEGPRKC